METLVIRFLIGGMVVSLFAALGDVLRPSVFRAVSEPHLPLLWRPLVLSSTRTERLMPFLNVA